MRKLRDIFYKVSLLIVVMLATVSLLISQETGLDTIQSEITDVANSNKALKELQADTITLLNEDIAEATKKIKRLESKKSIIVSLNLISEIDNLRDSICIVDYNPDILVELIADSITYSHNRAELDSLKIWNVNQQDILSEAEQGLVDKANEYQVLLNDGVMDSLSRVKADLSDKETFVKVVSKQPAVVSWTEDQVRQCLHNSYDQRKVQSILLTYNGPSLTLIRNYCAETKKAKVSLDVLNDWDSAEVAKLSYDYDIIDQVDSWRSSGYGYLATLFEMKRQDLERGEQNKNIIINDPGSCN